MLTLPAARVLWHLLCQVKLDVGADSFEPDATLLAQTKRELEQILGELQQAEPEQ